MNKPVVAMPLGATLVVLSSVFYASYGIWTKLLGDVFDGYTASALRSLVVLAVLIPIAFAGNQLMSLDWRHNWRCFAGLLITASLIWGPLYYAILNAGVGLSLAVNYSSIVLGMFLFGWLLSGERSSKQSVVPGVLGIVGLGLIFSPSGSGVEVIALGAAALSGVSIAAHMVFAKKLSYNATQSTIVVWVASALANIPMAALLREQSPLIGWRVEWLYLVAFALASVAASWMFVKGLESIDSGTAGLLGLSEIVFGVIFGAVFFSERPGWIAIVGIALVIVAAALPYLQERNLRSVQ